MNERQKRLNKAFDYLRLNGKMKTQKDFAEAIGTQRSGLSAALNGNELYLTDGLFLKLYAAFPDMFNRDWLLRGVGEMTPTQSVQPQNIMVGSIQADALTLAARLIESTEHLRQELHAELEEVRALRQQLAALLSSYSSPASLMVAEPNTKENDT